MNTTPASPVGRRTAHRANALYAMLAVVALLTALVVTAGLRAQQSALSVHRIDRRQEQVMLADLTDQYLRFTLGGLQTVADGRQWVMTPGNAANGRALDQLLATNQLLSYAAVLTSLTGQPLAAAGGPVPGVAASGYRPLEADLLNGQPGLSGVLQSGAGPLLAMALPVRVHGQLAGLLIGYANLRTWPLEGYVQRLDLGAGANYQVLDASGQVIASSRPTKIGSQFNVPPADHGTPTGAVTTADGQVVSVAPLGLVGWSTATTQATGAFDAGLTGPFLWLLLAFAVLLVAAATALTVSEHRRRHALGLLADQAVIDPLTGVATRRLLDTRLDATAARMKRTGGSVAIVFCDVDGFKGINDRYGHAAGDQVLIATATRLRQCLRAEDLIARVGGDEFVALIEGVSPTDDFEELGQRIRDACRAPVQSGNRQVTSRLSVGIVIVSASGADLATALNAADLAMYEAKRAGGDAHLVSRLDAPAKAEAISLAEQRRESQDS